LNECSLIEKKGNQKIGTPPQKKKYIGWKVVKNVSNDVDVWVIINDDELINLGDHSAFY
jgi:hypothetical protein